MVKYGFGARQFGDHKISFREEVDFAEANGFDLIQIWYDAEKGFEIRAVEDKVEAIKNSNILTIIHAVLYVTEIKEHVERLIPILKYLGHKELIIHPKSKIIGVEGTVLLKNALESIINDLKKNDITLFLENNGRLNPVFSNAEELKMIFAELPEIEFLLDLAHIDDYDHLKSMVSVKYPKILHVADRHLEVIHEHLPVGKGNIDFNYIFKHVLKNYEGKIIFEVTRSTKDLVDSKNKISALLA